MATTTPRTYEVDESTLQNIRAHASVMLGSANNANDGAHFWRGHAGAIELAINEILADGARWRTYPADSNLDGAYVVCDSTVDPPKAICKASDRMDAEIIAASLNATEERVAAQEAEAG